MAGSNDKRKPFQGKKFHKDLREYKNQEIKRSLVHRARLRKNYFKLLDKEGELPPQEDENEESEEEAGTGRLKKPLPPQRAPPPQRNPPQRAPERKPLNFAERAKLAKERKEQIKTEQLQKVQERRRNLDEKNRQRERKKESLSKRTKSGQPAMGPKISNLLEQIKKNN